MTEIAKKIEFVSKLKDIIMGVKKNIKNVEYIVFKNKNYGCYTEFLVVEYDGNAKSVRTCTADDFNTIFDELSRLLNKVYEDEISYYNCFLESEIQERVFE